MDLHFHSWSEEQNEVVRHFYTALMFGHAEGAKVAAAMVDKLEQDKVNLSYHISYHNWIFQIAGLLHAWQISHQITRCIYHEG